jgi:hypothetical protein
MSQYIWFKLLVRGIGILLIGLSLPWLTIGLGQLVEMLADGHPFGGGYMIQVAMQALASVAQFAFGAYLLFGGAPLIRYCMRDLHSRCAACGYDLAGVATAVCPECGVSVAPSPRPESPTPMER